MPSKKTKKPPTPKRYLISLRVSHELARKLQAAATASERGLAAEAEARIEQTFRLSEKSELDALRLRYGPFLGILMLAGEAAVTTGLSHVATGTMYRMRRAEIEGRDTKSDEALAGLIGDPFEWLDDPAGYRKAVAAANLVLQAFSPPEDGKGDMAPTIKADNLVNHTLRDIHSLRLAILRSQLGDLIKRLPPPTAATEPRSSGNFVIYAHNEHDPE